jgi:preprotein translocase subunit SecD
LNGSSVKHYTCRRALRVERPTLRPSEVDMRNLRLIFFASVALTLLAVYVDLPGTSDVFGHGVRINKGIDIAGGARLLLCAKGHPTDSAMTTARDVINSRAAGGIGVIEPQVNRVGSTCISVELPGATKQSAIQSLGKTGYLALTDAGTTALAQGARVTLVCPPTNKNCGPNFKVGTTDLSHKPYPQLQIVVPGDQISQGSAQVGFASDGSAVVNYGLKGQGSTDWCTYTTNHVQAFSAIVLDNLIVSDPTIQQAICGGQTQISGNFTTDTAKQLATYLNYGALPVALHVDSSQEVSASLGPQYVRDAYIAGIIGFIIVALFMLIYYRLPGALAVVALLMYAAVTFAAYKLVGVTITLAGIAGFILSIGMAVDANVLIFERMREELRAGKTLGAAVDSGFRRAFPSIRDSNASTIITTIILYVFGHNFAATTITGFALTLGIGVAISFITAVYVSHTFLRLVVISGRAREASYYGVDTLAGGRASA